jgi:hypothetical protein
MLEVVICRYYGFTFLGKPDVDLLLIQVVLARSCIPTVISRWTLFVIFYNVIFFSEVKDHPTVSKTNIIFANL